MPLIGEANWLIKIIQKNGIIEIAVRAETCTETCADGQNTSYNNQLTSQPWLQPTYLVKQSRASDSTDFALIGND